MNVVYVNARIGEKQTIRSRDKVINTNGRELMDLFETYDLEVTNSTAQLDKEGD